MDQSPRVLVSAGASGIGAAIADRFRADGARVSICDSDAAAVRAATTRDPARHGVIGDVADETDTRHWVG